MRKPGRVSSKYYLRHNVCDGSSRELCLEKLVGSGLLVGRISFLVSRYRSWDFSRNFLFGLPAIKNIHASASHRVQCFLREDHQLRASLSGSPKTVQSASKPSFFRQLSIPGG